MIFTALVILVLVCFVASIVNVGQMIVQRIRVQNAVDAAALAAGVWQARGLNLLQILNGLHWDLNYGTAIAIDLCIPLLEEWIPPEVPELAYKAIKGLDKLQELGATAIQGAQDLIVETFPYIALMHANGLAKDNGADPLLQCIADGIDSLPGMSGLANAGVRDIFSNIPLYIWTLYPSIIWPPDSTSLKVKKVDPGRGADSPYEMYRDYTYSLLFWVIPYGTMLYFEGIGWNRDYYYDEDGELAPITFVAGTGRKDAYMLGGLFNRSDPGNPAIIAPTIGVASVQTSGDDLNPAGESGSWFRNTPFLLFWGWPLPALRIVTGYKGNFDTELVPVKLTGGIDGETLLIYH